jgi:hypothetical protein
MGYAVRFGVVALLAGLAVAVTVARAETEEPRFTVTERVGEVEIRQYDNRLAADVVVTGSEEDARSAGFRLLADYIFGNNTSRTSIPMTAPVAQQPARNEKIPMTAPVAQSRGPGGSWRVRFFMPSKYTLATLPKPNNPAVQIVEVPGETMAVLRFSNSRDAAHVEEKTNELMRTLAASRWLPSGDPVAWFYDPPWTLPFFRRNEVAVTVRAR